MSESVLWHAISDSAVCEKLSASADLGLSSSEVAERSARYGKNVLTPKKTTSPLVMFLLQFHQPLIYILLFSSLVTGFLKEWVDAGVIFGVVLVNAVIGFVQEMKARSAMDALSKALTSEATVIRDGADRKSVV